MNNLLDIIQSQLNDNLIDQLAQHTNGNKEQTREAAEASVTTILKALQKNAENPQSAEALNNALERDHDGSILGNLGSILFGNSQPANPKAADGAGILGHILGNNSNNVIDMVSQMSGLGKTSAGKMLISLAPLVMGALGQAKRQNNVDSTGLASLLGGALSQTSYSNNPKMDFISRILDADGDGSIMDDIGNIGMKIAGSFFGKK